jgi:ribosomal protein RSM22 (predicted rRNA methylase)
VLDELWGGAGRVPPTRALDLGSGTGAVGRTLREWFGEPLDVVGVDRAAGPGVVRANLAVELPAVEGRFDLIVAAHLLNELFVERAPGHRLALRTQRVLTWARTLLAPAGFLILIEPALRETSRELLAVRDELLKGGLHVVAPCFWQGPCPALASERDWCHDAAPVDSRARVDFSYLVLQAEPLESSRQQARVVSDQIHDKGRMRLFICGLQGRTELVRLSRHRSPQNAALDKVSRGGVIRLPGTPASTVMRVLPETLVET